jgi:hypothetical protein
MSHTTTGEWKSFEVRMRHRRVERLLHKATVAAEAGRFEDAREALAEARHLAPTAPGLNAADQRVTQLATASAHNPTSRGHVLVAAILAGFAILGVVAGITLARRHAPLPAPPATPPANASRAAEARTLRPSSGAADRDDHRRSDAAPVRIETTAVTPPIVAGSGDAVPSAAPERPSDPPPTGASLASAPAPVTQLTAAPPEMPVSAPPPPASPPASAPVTELLTLPDAPPIPPPAPPRTAEPLSSLAIAVRTPAPTVEGPAVAAAVTSVSDETLVQRVLNRYATAYSRLDARAAQEAWPSVNGPALARAFESLASQQVSLENCAIDVRGVTAHAACNGKTVWRPKIGSGGTHTEQHNWAFDLVKAGDGWRIASARVQNR